MSWCNQAKGPIMRTSFPCHDVIIHVARSLFQKRNAAQLRRLKSQVREIQLQQRQWSDEATRLEDCISKMKQ